MGGTTASARNVISGNGGSGVEIAEAGTTGNLVEGDFIGTSSSGTTSIGTNIKPLGNMNGVYLFNAYSNTIGGTTAGARDVISGNLVDGVQIVKAGPRPRMLRGIISAPTTPVPTLWAMVEPASTS